MKQFLLTFDEIDAVIEALSARLAGEIDDDLPPIEVYESAHKKLCDLRDKRKKGNL